MELPEETLSDVRARLRRVQGQLGGVVDMLDAGRECGEVVQQLSAASRALDRAAFRLLASGLRHCVQEGAAGRETGYTPDELEKLFLQMA